MSMSLRKRWGTRTSVPITKAGPDVRVPVDDPPEVMVTLAKIDKGFQITVRHPGKTLMGMEIVPGTYNGTGTERFNIMVRFR